MQDEVVQPNQDFLKKLRKKAELCRFSHSELKAKYSRWRDLKEFSVVLLSVSLAGLIGFYYRKVLEGDLVLSLIFILPLIITLVQTSDHTIFKWTHKAARHESAVAIWEIGLERQTFLRNAFISMQVIWRLKRCKTCKKNITVVWVTQNKYQTTSFWNIKRNLEDM